MSELKDRPLKVWPSEGNHVIVITKAEPAHSMMTGSPMMTVTAEVQSHGDEVQFRWLEGKLVSIALQLGLLTPNSETTWGELAAKLIGQKLEVKITHNPSRWDIALALEESNANV